MQPYTAVIFSSRHTGIDETGYADTAAEMERLAAEQPGFRGIESARGADGFGIGSALYKPGMPAEAVAEKAARIVSAYDSALAAGGKVDG